MKIIEKRPSDDGSVKYLLGTEDGLRVESVFLVLEDNHKDSLCISSQVGCALGCKFCSTGLLGLARNLTADEIVAQVDLVLGDMQFHQRRRFDLSYMGMGEPLQNFDAVVESKTALRAKYPDFTFYLSTVGLVPAIHRLAACASDFGLQVSLHAPTDAIRDRILPINRKYPVAELLDAADAYAKASGRPTVLNYCLLDGVNDAPEHALELARAVRGKALRVQLVRFNPHEWLEFTPSTHERALEFLAVLQAEAITSHYGRQLGRGIGAGCGQLDADYRQHELRQLSTRGRSRELHKDPT